MTFKEMLAQAIARGSNRISGSLTVLSSGSLCWMTLRWRIYKTPSCIRTRR